MSRLPSLLLATFLCLGAISCLAEGERDSPAEVDPTGGGPRGGKGDRPDPTGGDTRQHESSGKSWTYMIYMLGDNNLEQATSLDLIELAEVGSSDDFHIVVLADRAPEYDEEGVLNLESWVDAKYIRVEEGELKVEQELGEVDMGDPQTLIDFVDWAAKAYPADRYALSFWDHGGSWNGGFGPDDTSIAQGLDGTLTLEEIGAALPEAMAMSGIDQFALIGFDTCLLGTWEMIDVVRPHAEYMLASEEIAPGKGWDYRVLSAIRDDPTLDGLAFGGALLDGFLAAHPEPWITLSLVDLYALDPLYEAVEALGALLLERFDELAISIKKTRWTMKSYGGVGASGSSQAAALFGLVDLGDLVEKLAEREPQIFAPVRDQVLAALSLGVARRVAGPAAPEAHGVAIYFPQRSTDYDPRYMSQRASSGAWERFIERYATSMIPEPAPRFDEEQSALSAELPLTLRGVVAENGEFAIHSDLYYGFVREGERVLVGREPAKMNDAHTEVIGQWDGSHLEMVQGELSSPVYVAWSEDATYLQTELPVFYLPPGVDQVEHGVALSLFYTLDKNTGEDFVQAMQLSESGTYGEVFLEEGSRIIPYVYRLNERGEFEPSHEGVSFDPNRPYGFDIVSYGSSEVFMELYMYGPNGEVATLSRTTTY